MNPHKTELNDDELSRYSRQILLSEIDYSGQLILAQSHAVIFGLGGLGSPAALYLAAAGVGSLTLVDFDTVDDSNLQRQIIHTERQLGEAKVISAKKQLQALNRHIQIDPINHQLDTTELNELVHRADIVLDCTDNFASRYALNQACFENKKPLVSGAAIRWEGQLTTFDFRNETSPCYQCLYKSAGQQNETCTQNGVLAPLVGMIGSMQAMEAIKALLNLPTLAGKLMIIDGLTLQIRTLKLPKESNCPTCST
ncbi:MAG: molybdopterin-synthase adenylyltransferase MoeB [Piscirickettsiaceae bacterium CG_4_9_14_3_um_filter_43_564]|nr:molybdopterin-synthase adenylyltransferase MoeB [Thiomicrospira sp.]PIQ04519.1 MAG: molybdopterin-synthase adenylyltransferase MoeB [Piscirickettsiaceae bacterium CG18_big_fil_WC_8_21_14_2_50_44_103]PIU38719.1 MAG: molybdopterin-synthase adenylyltransferase MoeB [Piscirickettsiaceae bacterium CG07_land_8_20_14_0_80_44_28]PIW58081.1 MAG: molybdopterin-synthase adenylyltransferase MoeB [Piscirickettsiaceae bacterium CG12_big_fil_rev_8_21_14_0_65_44_934]PIW78221.1 MAG: molybdopterin-synthase ad